MPRTLPAALHHSNLLEATCTTAAPPPPPLLLSRAGVFQNALFVEPQIARCLSVLGHSEETVSIVLPCVGACATDAMHIDREPF